VRQSPGVQQSIDFSRVAIECGNSWKAKWLPVSSSEKAKLLHRLCLRAAYLAARSDPANAFNTAKS
jgi:hypothetical protein